MILSLCLISMFCTEVYAVCSMASFRGGGSFGAVEVGMFQRLLDTNQIPDRLDVLTGVSAGGLNVGFLSAASGSYNLTESATVLSQVYEGLTNDQVYDFHLLKMWDSWSFYQTDPLNATISSVLSKFPPSSASPTTLVGTTNLQTGLLEVVPFHTLTDPEDRTAALMATSAIPLVFPHVNWQGQQFVDGGLISNEILFQALPYLTCKDPEIWFFEPSASLVPEGQITSFTGFVHRLFSLVSNGFDNQLQKMLQKQPYTCPTSKQSVQLHVCHPNATGVAELADYSILDFNTGADLIRIGYNTVQCDVWFFCN
jgi:hypothetical protein